MSAGPVWCRGRRFALGVALAVLALPGLAGGPARAAEIGGQGTLRPGGGLSRVECFKTGTQDVPEVCGIQEVHWKLTTLMGEPVANAGLVWSISSVRIRVGKEVRGFPVDQLPAPLARAARRSELMVYGLGLFIGKGGAILAVDLDTGAPAPPNGKVSFNVPGSPDWSRFIINGGSSRLPSGDLTMGQQGWCATEGRSHLPPADAKDEMRRGVKLVELIVCPRTSASASALANALQDFCEKTPQGAYCEKKPKPDKPDLAHADALDKAADGPAVRRTHARLVEAFRLEAEAACRQDLAPVQACRRQQCPDPPGPDEARCKAVPAKPWRGLGPLLTRVDNSPCDARCERERERNREEARREREREDREFDAKEAAWESQWGDLSRQCQANREARGAQAQCEKASEGRCNPAGLTPQSCLDRRMAGAPTQAAARAVFDKQTQDRQRADERPRFLD